MFISEWQKQQHTQGCKKILMTRQNHIWNKYSMWANCVVQRLRIDYLHLWEDVSFTRKRWILNEDEKGTLILDMSVELWFVHANQL